MTVLSTGPFSISLVTNTDLFVPFVIYATPLPNPGFGNRWERIRELQKTAQLIEFGVEDFVETGQFGTDGDDFTFEIARPVSATVAFGNNKARITLVGHIRKGRETGNTPTDPAEIAPKKTGDDVDVINANEIRTGQGAFNAANFDHVEVVDEYASELRRIFSDNSIVQFVDRMKIDVVEVLGVRYGNIGRNSGRHFNNS